LAEASEAKETKKGRWLEGDVLYVADEAEIEKIADALASKTRLRILGLLFREEMGIEDLAERLKQSKANISTHVKKLESAGLVKSQYKPGHRGVKKVAKPIAREIRILLYTLSEGIEERLEKEPLPGEETGGR